MGPRWCLECGGSVTVLRPSAVCGPCTQQLIAQGRLDRDGTILIEPPPCPACALPLRWTPRHLPQRADWWCAIDGPQFLAPEPPTPVDLDQILEIRHVPQAHPRRSARRAAVGVRHRPRELAAVG